MRREVSSGRVSFDNMLEIVSCEFSADLDVKSDATWVQSDDAEVNISNRHLLATGECLEWHNNHNILDNIVLRADTTCVHSIVFTISNGILLLLCSLTLLISFLGVRNK